MHKQAEAFLDGEGDAWYARNRDKPRLPDPVLEAIGACGITPQRVLEIGCGDGWRLREISKKYRCWHMGCDAAQGVTIQQFMAERLVKQRSFDLVIFGWCLYVIDREDLLKVVAYTDEVLEDGGYIVIHDFQPPVRPYKVKYKHKDGLFSYHMDYAQLWLAHPGYQHLNTIDAGEKGWVKVLKKDFANAFPLREI